MEGCGLMFEIKGLCFKDILNIPYVLMNRQITCIVGASGCGKTTLLRMLNRLNSPDEGSILYNGKDILSMDPIELRRNIVMLGQTPIMYPGTIEDNLQIGRILSNRPKASNHKLVEYLKIVKLDKELNEGCSKLSGGEKQRLCLARVLLMDASVYLVDEPSSALDKETEAFVIENLVHYVREHDKELIMVTHSSDVELKYPKSLLKIEEHDCKGYMYE